MTTKMTQCGKEKKLRSKKKRLEIAEKEDRVPKAIRLDLACGERKNLGFIGVDKHKTSCCDVVQDLTQYPWPWKDNSVDEIICQHFFEHLTGAQRIDFMNEVYRIMKPTTEEEKHEVRIIVPYYSSVRAYQDPTHQWPPVVENAFLYFNKGWREINGVDHYLGISANFDFTYGYSITDPEVINRVKQVRDQWIKNKLNVVDDLIVVLTKISPKTDKIVEPPIPS